MPFDTLHMYLNKIEFATKKAQTSKTNIGYNLHEQSQTVKRLSILYLDKLNLWLTSRITVLRRSCYQAKYNLGTQKHKKNMIFQPEMAQEDRKEPTAVVENQLLSSQCYSV